jgi:hypothetical protein
LRHATIDEQLDGGMPLSSEDKDDTALATSSRPIWYATLPMATLVFGTSNAKQALVSGVLTTPNEGREMGRYTGPKFSSPGAKA